MDKLPPSAPQQPIESPTNDKVDNKVDKVKKWMKNGRRVIVATVKKMLNLSFKAEMRMPPPQKLTSRDIEHITLSDAESMSSTSHSERKEKFLNAIKQKKGVNDLSTEDMQVYRKLGSGSEGRADFVFKDLSGPLEVKKTLFKKSKNSERETALLKRLDHPNIIKISSVDEVDSNSKSAHITKDGGNALGGLVPNKKNPSPLSRSLFTSIARQMADVLVYLKQEQVLHRDIKPENIVIDQTGNITLIDFGIAYDKKIQSACNPRGIGTEAYMEPSSDYDKFGIQYSDTNDMFATGQTLYKLLTGTLVDMSLEDDSLGIEIPYTYEQIRSDIHRKLTKALKGESRNYIDVVADLIARMVEPDPALRITPEEFKNHRLIRNVMPPKHI